MVERTFIDIANLEAVIGANKEFLHDIKLNHRVFHPNIPKLKRFAQSVLDYAAEHEDVTDKQAAALIKRAIWYDSMVAADASFSDSSRESYFEIVGEVAQTRSLFERLYPLAKQGTYMAKAVPKSSITGVIKPLLGGLEEGSRVSLLQNRLLYFGDTSFYDPSTILDYLVKAAQVIDINSLDSSFKFPDFVKLHDAFGNLRSQFREIHAAEVEVAQTKYSLDL
jgi:hypothetical protein